MNIEKIGHCCLHIKHNDITILTDPGSFTDEQNSVTGIDIVLITHEHGDHLHVDSLKEVIKNNPKVQVITNSGVGKILQEENIEHTILEGKDTTTILDTLFEAFDARHEEIFEERGQVQNTGYFIGEKLFYPGDAYSNPEKPVDTLALAVAGPWCKVPDVIRYALEIKPKKAFPVHDAMIKDGPLKGVHGHVDAILSKNNIEFVSMVNGDTKEF